MVTEKSYGILSVVPKDKDGNAIENLEDHIIYTNGQELKAWVAVAKYIIELHSIILFRYLFKILRNLY